MHTCADTGQFFPAEGALKVLFTPQIINSRHLIKRTISLKSDFPIWAGQGMSLHVPKSFPSGVIRLRFQGKKELLVDSNSKTKDMKSILILPCNHTKHNLGQGWSKLVKQV